MKRSALKRTQSLGRGAVEKTRTRLNPISAKRSQKMREGKAQLLRLIEERGNRCQVSPSFNVIGVTTPNCRNVAEGRHHLRKQSDQGSDEDANVLLSCNPCNDMIEDRPMLAITAGLVVRQGDPRWGELGRG